MAVIGSLAVALTAQTRGFSRGMSEAGRSVNSFASGVRSVQGTLLKFGGVLAGFAGAAGLGMLIKQQMAAMGTATDFASRIGLTTEALVGLRHAGEMTGVAARDVDMGMQRMTRRIAAAAAGGGPAVAALQKLGLSAQELAALAPDEQFKRIADAMGGIESQGEKVQTAFAIFDSGGVGLLNTMRDGAAGISAAQAEAERLGITFSQIDGAKVGEAGNAVARLGQAVKGVAMRAAVGLAPVIANIANAVTSAVVTVRQTVLPAVGGIIKSVIGGLQSLLGFMAPFWIAMENAYTSALRAVWSAVSGTFSAVMGLFGPLEGSLSGLGEMITWLRDTATLAMLSLEFGFTNWKDMVEFAAISAAASVVAFANQITHFFGAVVPTLLSWFADNWEEIFLTVGANTLTFFENLAGNIVRVVKSIPAMLKGQVDFADVWTPLGDGFVNVIKDLPQIPERQIGELEAALKGEAARLGASIAGEFDSFVGARLGEIDAQAKGVAGFFDGLLDLEIPELSLKLDPGAQASIDNFSAAQGHTEFQQISMSRVAINGVERAGRDTQKVEDPQIKETNRYLKQMAERPRPAVAS